MAVARALDSVLEPAVGNDDPDELLTTRRKGRSLERPALWSGLLFSKWRSGGMKMRETVTKIALTPAVLLVTAEVHELPTAPTAA